MFFLTPIIAAFMVAGTLGVGTYLQDEAKSAVEVYNLSAISHVLEIYYVDHGTYPQNLNELIFSGEIKNLKAKDYSYSIALSGQQYKVCSIETYECSVSL